jgi:L-gulonolactone oxidase
VVAPATLADAQDAVRFAKDKKLCIQTIGKRYSRSDLVRSNGCLIDMCKLNAIIAIDSLSKNVTVQAGIELKDLSEKLALEGLSLPNLPATSVTLGGALNTASHGTGKTGSLSQFVTEMELLVADGTVKKLSKDKHPDLFAAARVGLGALGIVYSVTLQCVPLFDLVPHERTVSLKEALDNYKKWFDSNDYFQFIWNVTNDTAACHWWNKVEHASSKDLVATQPAHDTLLWFCEVGVEKDLATEHAVPFDNLPQALDAIKKIYTHYHSAGLKTSPVVVRFANPDKDILLSPNGDRTVAYVNVWCPVDGAYQPLLKAVDAALCKIGGRPHWGKINYMDYEKASTLYGSKFAKFIAAKKKLDPDNIFSNDYINQLFTKKGEL